MKTIIQILGSVIIFCILLSCEEQPKRESFPIELHHIEVRYLDNLVDTLNVYTNMDIVDATFIKLYGGNKLIVRRSTSNGPWDLAVAVQVKSFQIIN